MIEWARESARIGSGAIRTVDNRVESLIPGGKKPDEDHLKNNALKIDDKDNVAIATRNMEKGVAVVIDGKRLFEAAEVIEAGHKIALAPIDAGEKVFRYGEPIVETTRAIGLGEWVHVHNTQPIPGDLKE